MKKILITTSVIFGITALTGCKQTAPVVEQPITNAPSVQYKVPADMNFDLSFNSFNRCLKRSDDGSCFRSDRLTVNKASGELVVRREISEPFTGAQTQYKIREKITRSGDINTITYQPMTVLKKDGGLLLPIPAPDLDIADYLSTTQFTYKFEVDSQYPSDSVKANFDRLMNKTSDSFRFYGAETTSSTLKLQDSYMYDLGDAFSVILVESFPYRNGSKVVVNVIIETKQTPNGVIDVEKLLNQVKSKVNETVNA
ncbi:hypothetical protein [Alteromonas sp. CYL-A6]|uniref:hypothetical protein n=1 Tax=Alteromonas nitratireducens TaxID=3390813 RepID=UPI0034B6AE2C